VTDRPLTHGLVGAYATPEALVRAASLAREAGYRQMDAYSPMPVHGLSEALGLKPSRLPWVVLGGGLVGLMSGLGMQYWMTVIDFPMNVGGRPLASWPSFVPVTFEVTILFAALTTVIAMILRNRLPQPHHAIFNAPGFERASTDRFFLCIEALDPKFEPDLTRRFLEASGAEEVSDVAA
jgi:hypothetical protein